MNILDRFRLDGKIALVTGCNRGIGRAMAQALAEAGADIAGVSATMQPSGSEVEADIRALGRRFTGYRCDLADRAALYAFIEQAKRDLGRVDILINNAGICLRKPAEEYPDEYWDRVIAIDLTAQFILAREFGKEMLARGYGKIVFTASMLTFQGGILIPAYAASKAGVGQLTKSLANEWAGRGVNVNAIAPGYIATDLTAAIQADATRSEQIVARIPSGRWGTPDDFKGAVVFLCSDAAAYVQGTILTVDGGWLSR